MAGKPFDVEIINQSERPLSGDVNETGSYAALALRELLLNLFASPTTTNANLYGLIGPAVKLDDHRVLQPAANSAAFIGSGFKVRAAVVPAMSVTVDAGLGFFNDNLPATGVGGVTGIDDLSTIKPLSLTALETIAVPTADAVNPRIDIIEVKLDRRSIDPTSRDVLSSITGAFVPNVVNKTLTYNQNGRSTVNGSGSINYKTGTPGVSPSAPAVDAGYVKIAEIDVAANAAKIIGINVRDVRLLLGVNGQLQFSCDLYVAVNNPGIINVLNTIAPPGVQLSAVYVGNNQAEFQLLVVAGGLPNAITGQPHISVSVIGNEQAGNLPSGVSVPVWRQPFGSPNVISWGAGATTVSQTELNKSVSLLGYVGPTLATGQPCWVSNNIFAQSASGGFAGNVNITYGIQGIIPTI